MALRFYRAAPKAALPAIGHLRHHTSPEQRVITGVLADIHSKVEAANLTGPTLLIFGKVVESRQQVNTLLLHSSKHAATI